MRCCEGCGRDTPDKMPLCEQCTTAGVVLSLEDVEEFIAKARLDWTVEEWMEAFGDEVLDDD